jgi:hypothetical protein
MRRDELLKSMYELEEVILPKTMNKEELEEFKNDLNPNYSYRYILFNEYNVIRFSLKIGHYFPICITIEWNEIDIKCKIYSQYDFVKSIELNRDNINYVLKILYKNDFFSLDINDFEEFAIISGSGVKDWSLEIKIGDDYNGVSTTFFSNEKLVNILNAIFSITTINIDEIIKKTLEKIDDMIKYNINKYSKNNGT